MASSSSSSSSVLSPKYDVFLSFRGEDTRYNFISHLTKGLGNKKIQTFIDDEKLKRGDEISPALISAIEQSKISIIIFSENYADSKWCLEELQKILECQKKQSQNVIPVFYNVDPTHVRNQTGSFGTAFDRLLKNIAASIYPNLVWRILLPSLYLIWNIGASESGKEQIWKILLSFLFIIWNITASKAPKEQIWRKALKEAANLSGFHSFNVRSEATLIDNIIADVLEKLQIGSGNACDDRGLVGINSHVEKIVHLLDIESPEIRMIGIWGMGGMGKTTIAEAVFNKLCSEFDNRSFLKNVRETVKQDGLGCMRDKLISKLLKDETMEIETPHLGNESTKERLRRTKVLVVLDDVDNSLQLEELIGAHGTNQIGQGSIVIVTTRDRHVLEAHDITCVYAMQMLDDRDALELFCFYAFRQNQPSELYREISEEFVKYAKGVPLALKVLGSSVRGKVSIGHWRGELKKLKRIPNKQISEVLKISYDSLSEEEKDIFLDISCFFKGMDVNTIRNVLDGGYVSLLSGIEVLMDKSLINITPADKWIWHGAIKDSINVVEMHDLVQEMGWNIVIGESKTAGSRSRLWRDTDVYDVLTKNTGTDKIKAIFFNTSAVMKMNLDPQAFAKMHNLKFLKIIDSFWSSKIEFPSGLESLPEGLRYLEWRWYPLEYLPPAFNPTSLVKLYLRGSCLKRLWSGRQDLSNLKGLCLGLCGDLIELPDLSRGVNIEELSLHSDYDWGIFSSSIQYLNSLKYLNLRYCALTKISSSLQQLTNLTNLNLNYCTKLMNISSSIQYLTNLTYLSFNHCDSLREIPQSIQHLKNLTHLDLTHCISLREIPQSIKHLKSLTYLNLNECESLNEIPSSIQHLNSLTHLKIGGCTNITKLPNLPQNIKLLIVDEILIEVHSLLIDHPSGLLTNLVELELWNCTIDHESSIFLEKIKLLIPRGCKFIRKDEFESTILQARIHFEKNKLAKPEECIIF